MTEADWDGIDSVREQRDQLRAQRDVLLAACKDALGTITHEPAMQPVLGMWPVAQTVAMLTAAIAKVDPLAGEQGPQGEDARGRSRVV